MAKSEAKAVEKLSFEEAYAELETIVAAMEAGELPLDETMKLFERGQTLVKHCTELLDRADLKIKQLSGDTLTDLSEA